MLKRICDRCGKTIGCGPYAYDMPDNMTIIHVEHGPFEKKCRDIGAVKSSYYDCKGEKTTCDLCEDCYKAFKNWLIEVDEFNKLMKDLEKQRIETLKDQNR